MRVLWLLPWMACNPDMIIRGTVENDDGSIWAGSAVVEVVTWGRWTGELTDDEGDAFLTETDDGTFSFTVAPGHWAVIATSGTCSSAPAEEVIGEPGSEAVLDLEVHCFE